jgi:uncharacterized protein (AIM24 family)
LTQGYVLQYTKESGSGTVALGTDYPSKVIRVSLGRPPWTRQARSIRLKEVLYLFRAADYGGALVCQKGAFLAGSHTIDIQMVSVWLKTIL